MSDSDQLPAASRESIWSISAGWKTTYFFLFTIQSLCGVGLLSWNEITQSGNDGVVQTILDIILGTASIGVAAATITISLTEALRGTMVIGAYLEEHLLKPLRERRRAEGRAEGRAHTQKMWEAWNRRRLEAMERGDPFDEPTPEIGNGA